MIILQPKEYKILSKIPLNNRVDYPDVVLYDKLFSSEKIYNSIKNILKNSRSILFTDHPKIKKGNPFPRIIESMRDKIAKITGYNFNSCLVKKYNNHNYTFFKQLDNQENVIIPFVSLGNPRVLEYISKNKNKNTTRVILNDGTLLVQRESVIPNWKPVLIEKGDNKGDELFYSLIFYEINYFDEEPVSLLCSSMKKIPNRVKLPYSLKFIYTKTKLRVALSEVIRRGLQGIHKYIKQGDQCININNINYLSDYIKILHLIGKGDWGNIYSACLKNEYDKQYYSRRECRKFALKMARITQEEYENPYTSYSLAWYEIWMLKDIFKPLIINNICPNLPLYMDTFLCKKCEFIFRKGDKESHPCITNIMELASGDFYSLLKEEKMSDEHLFSALFQIMAAVHAIQMTGQILNNDIKGKNIIYYDIIPGGYWIYKINDIKFYVPNMGKLFVLTDFGVSTLFNPNFQLYRSKKNITFNLGSRYAININGKFSPLNSEFHRTSQGKANKGVKIVWSDGKISQGGKFRVDRQSGRILNNNTLLTSAQKSYLFRKGVGINPRKWEFFEIPHLIPPFEFYNDVQDVLRTFLGGKRTTQRGNHTTFSTVSNKFRDIVRPYMGKAVNSQENNFSLNSYEVLAGDFITKFFTDIYSYRKKPQGKKLSIYDMNTPCLESILIK
jgi:hypothetical protein